MGWKREMGMQKWTHGLEIYVAHFNSYQKGSTMEMVVKNQGLKMT